MSPTKIRLTVDANRRSLVRIKCAPLKRAIVHHSGTCARLLAWFMIISEKKATNHQHVIFTPNRRDLSSNQKRHRMSHLVVMPSASRHTVATNENKEVFFEEFSPLGLLQTHNFFLGPDTAEASLALKLNTRIQLRKNYFPFKWWKKSIANPISLPIANFVELNLNNHQARICRLA